MKCHHKAQEIDRSYSMQREITNSELQLENLKRRDHVKKSDVDGRIILKRICKIHCGKV